MKFKKFEYMILPFFNTKVLNDVGQAGWELAAILPHELTPKVKTQAAYLKREIK